MASCSSLLSEDQFQCSICLDVFTDTVTIPCGHNFCKACITKYWDNSGLCQCPMCKMTFDKRPDLFVNTFISEMAAQEAERELADNVQVFTALVRSIERSQAELIEVIEEKQKAAEKQAEGLIKDLEQEITELKRRSTELEQLSHTEDHLHLLQSFPSLSNPPHTKDWPEISVHSGLSVVVVRRAVSQLEETLNEEMEKLPEVKLKRIQQYAVDVTLDPDTAHRKLILSEDGKQVRNGDKKQDLPDNPERFDYFGNVLGKQGFSSGRFYYEVQVEGKTDWILGLVRESINRKETTTLSPEDGYWTVSLMNGDEYRALADPYVLLSLRQKPQKVGVFVDYEEGLVSFYGVEARSHIYSFTGCTFTEKLYPVFNPCRNDGGKNSAPLIITTSNINLESNNIHFNQERPVTNGCLQHEERSPMESRHWCRGLTTQPDNKQKRQTGDEVKKTRL
ncbi:zinc-binding protein A33-like [Osmerus eperlanus]|uniref:zinc-binding protein A33-like n=1 Tax=Osmerus eperlanus TaxID=29151 RepID=UPI002E0F0D0A